MHERAVTPARIRITDIVGGATAMSFGEKKFAARFWAKSYGIIFPNFEVQ